MKSRWYEGNFFALSAALVLCVACVVMACAVPAWLSSSARAGPRAGPVDVIPLCAWARHGSVGLWWNANIAPTAAIARAPRYNAVCVAAPWSSLLPERGRPAFDVTP